MANLQDIGSGAVPAEDPAKQVESVIRQVNEWGRALSNEDRTKLYKDNSGKNRIIIGLLPNGDHGMRVSQEGFDVVEAADDELVFNSSQNIPKIVASGTKTLIAATSSSVAADVDISSLGLENPPLLLCAAVSPASSATYLSMPFVQDPSTTSKVVATSWVNFIPGTDEEIRFQVELGSAAAGYAGTWTFKYYVLQETAN